MIDEPWDKNIDWKFWAMYGGGALAVLLVIVTCCFVCYCIKKSRHEDVVGQKGQDEDDSVDIDSSSISVRDSDASSVQQPSASENSTAHQRA